MLCIKIREYRETSETLEQEVFRKEETEPLKEKKDEYQVYVCIHEWVFSDFYK